MVQLGVVRVRGLRVVSRGVLGGVVVVGRRRRLCVCGLRLLGLPLLLLLLLLLLLVGECIAYGIGRVGAMGGGVCHYGWAVGLGGGGMVAQEER